MAIEGHTDVESCLLGIINFEDSVNEQEMLLGDEIKRPIIDLIK